METVKLNLGPFNGCVNSCVSTNTKLPSLELSGTDEGGRRLFFCDGDFVKSLVLLFGIEFLKERFRNG